MTIRNLQFMLNPSSVGLIGIYEKPLSLGRVVGRNLCNAGFRGKIFAVPPTGETIDALPNYFDLNHLPGSLDLAVITALPDAAGDFIAELRARGVKAIAILSDDFSEQDKVIAKTLSKTLSAETKSQLLRMVGPHSLGILVPGIGLNASFSHVQPLSGNLAFVTQSGTVLASVLDWAASRNIGFSHLVSLGDMIDVDFGDMLDYLAGDDNTEVILLHLERVNQIRKFISAARVAAREKPVIVLKAGRHAEAARRSVGSPGEPIGADAVYDAAFLRAGMLRVYDIQELLDTAETFAINRSVSGDRLAILTNGEGVELLAADAVLDGGAQLAQLSPDSVSSLSAILSPKWSPASIINLNADADGRRYGESLEVLFADKGVDAVLVMNCPNALASSEEAAQAVIDKVRGSGSKRKSQGLLTCWLGDGTAAAARRLFAANRIATYETPHAAVRGFMQMVRYRRNREMLMETPPPIPESFIPDSGRAQRTVEQALADGRKWLTSEETRSVLAAYRIPTGGNFVEAESKGPQTAVTELDQTIGRELHSSGSSPGSVAADRALDLEIPGTQRQPAGDFLQILRNVSSTGQVPDYGFLVDEGRTRPYELQIGMVEDVQFGPVLLLGRGGVVAELMQDFVLALPPVNMHLAREALSRTRFYRLLEGCDRLHTVDSDGIAFTLVKISQLVCDIAEIAQLYINPLVSDSSGVIALDARIRVARSNVSAAERLAIRPYPKELEKIITLADGQKMLLRPIKPEDEPGFLKLFSSLTTEEVRLRFLNPIKALSHTLAARLTQIDYDREMALVLVGTSATGEPELCGSVRITADPDNERAEFAVLLRHDMTGLGLGPLLMRRIIEHARSRGISEIFGEVLDDNDTILRLCEVFGFSKRSNRDDPGIVNLTLKL